MAGQGKITREYATQLSDDGWNILYICIPNTPHLKVVPIPTSHGVSKQRYPDIVAVKDNRLLLVEVEMNLTKIITEDIVLRFTEMRQSLFDSNIYSMWSKQVEFVSTYKMPTKPIIETRLKIVNGVNQKSFSLVNQLESQCIMVI